jgi:hypothetical protein
MYADRQKEITWEATFMVIKWEGQISTSATMRKHQRRLHQHDVALVDLASADAVQQSVAAIAHVYHMWHIRDQLLTMRYRQTDADI